MVKDNPYPKSALRHIKNFIAYTYKLAFFQKVNNLFTVPSNGRLLSYNPWILTVYFFYILKLNIIMKTRSLVLNTKWLFTMIDFLNVPCIAYLI